MPRVHYEASDLKNLLWPGINGIRITGARWSDLGLTLTIEGDELPEGAEELKPIVARYERTWFSPMRPLPPR